MKKEEMEVIEKHLKVIDQIAEVFISNETDAAEAICISQVLMASALTHAYHMKLDNDKEFLNKVDLTLESIKEIMNSYVLENGNKKK